MHRSESIPPSPRHFPNRRTLALWFPNWPIQRYLNNLKNSAELKTIPSASPLVILYDSGPGGNLQVAACSQELDKRGVQPGVSLTEARLLVEDISSRVIMKAITPEADREALLFVAEQCLQYSPLISFDEEVAPEGLFLQIQGCSHLFGGEYCLAQRILETSKQLGYAACVGVASTPGVAWAAARMTSRAKRIILVASESMGEFLQSTPVSLLRLDRQTIKRLAEFGLHTIGQIQQLPRKSLPSRFGTNLLNRLDQALGKQEEALTALEFPGVIHSMREFSQPLADRNLLEHAVGQLTEELIQELKPQQGICWIRWTFQNAQTGSSETRVTGSHNGLKHVRQQIQSAPNRNETSLTECQGTSRASSEFSTFWKDRRITEVKENRLGRKQNSPFAMVSAEDMTWFDVRCAKPTRSPQKLIALTCLQWDRVALPANVEKLTAEVLSVELITSPQRDLFGNSIATENMDSLELIERLGIRLGHEHVLRVKWIGHPLPERSLEYCPAIQSDVSPATTFEQQSPTNRAQRSSSAKHDHQDLGFKGIMPSHLQQMLRFWTPITRPIMLLSSPEEIRVWSVHPSHRPLQWQFLARSLGTAGAREVVSFCWGPERIETGWWEDQEIQRDYWGVETHSGRRYWIYRDFSQMPTRWYVHGIFD